MMKPNKLNCLSVASLLSSPIFDSKAGAYPSGALGRLFVLPADIRSVLKGLPETNTHFFGLIVSNEEKSFITWTF